MKKNRKMTPEIRFPGFIDDWEQRKLSELATMHARIGWQNLRTSEFLDDGDYMLITGTDFEDGRINFSTCHYVEKERYDQDKHIQISDGSILITKDGTLGKVAYVQGLQKPATLNAGVFNVEIKDENEVDGKYLFQYLKAPFLIDYVGQKATGGTIKHLNQNILVDFPVVMPKKVEQEKIGLYFENIDNLSTLHQRKCDTIGKLKKSMLQKMFPKKGSTVPEIRFPGFTDAWEQRKLSDIYKDIGNAFVGTATPYYVEEGHFYLESNNIKDGQINHNTEVFINDEFYEKQRDKWLHTGDMVMVQSGHVGHAAVIPEELDCSAAHALIMFRNPKVEIEPYFLNYQYQTIKSKKKIENITTGNTIKHILASEMQEFVVDVTSYGEQEKIAGFFGEIDNLITLHQRKCECLEILKKAMLQKMFI